MAAAESQVARLVECTAEFKQDKFWRDLAKPVDRAIAAIKTGMRAEAIYQLQAALAQLPPADNAVGLFAEQRTKIGHVLAELEAAREAAASIAAVSEAVAPAAEPTPPPALHFEQDASEITLTIRPLPPATKPADVRVTFGRSRVHACLVGAEDAPLVSGELLHPVRTDGCSWALEGSGARRALVLTLEKGSEGLSWGALLAAEAQGGKAEAQRAEALNELVAGALADSGMGAAMQPLQPTAAQ